MKFFHLSPTTYTHSCLHFWFKTAMNSKDIWGPICHFYVDSPISYCSGKTIHDWISIHGCKFSDVFEITSIIVCDSNSGTSRLRVSKWMICLQKEVFMNKSLPSVLNLACFISNCNWNFSKLCWTRFVAISTYYYIQSCLNMTNDHYLLFCIISTIFF